MTKFRKMMEQFILEEKNSAKLIATLQEELAALRHQNNLLLDRIMSRNFEEFAHLKTEAIGSDVEIPEIEFDQDESIAGDVVDETE